MFWFIATEFRQGQRIMNVIFLAKAKICIVPLMQVVMEPTRACFLGTETEQKGPRSAHLASVDCDGWHTFDQVIDGFDLCEERFELIEG